MGFIPIIEYKQTTHQEVYKRKKRPYIFTCTVVSDSKMRKQSNMYWLHLADDR